MSNLKANSNNSGKAATYNYLFLQKGLLSKCGRNYMVKLEQIKVMNFITCSSKRKNGANCGMGLINIDVLRYYHLVWVFGDGKLSVVLAIIIALKCDMV
jgi:hypothetical protein